MHISLAPRRVFLSTATCALLGVAAAPLAAQTALGDGQSLDNNLQVGSGGRNQPGFTQGGYTGQYDTRNLIVTGNVAAGRGFRGTVGYQAANDFRADTGSDDLYRRRARSALSSLAFITSDVAYGSPLALGQAMGIVEYRRATSGANLGRMMSPITNYGEYLAVQDRLNELALSETSLNRSDATAQGRLLSVQPLQDGRSMSIRASENRGITLSDTRGDLPLVGLSVYDQARLLEDMNRGVASPLPGLAFDASEEISEYELVDGEIQANPLNNDLASVISSDYQDVLTGVAEGIVSSSEVEGTDLAGQMQAQLDSFQTLLSDLDKLRAERTEPEGTIINRPAIPDADPTLEARPAIERPAEDLNFAALRHNRTMTNLAPDDTASRFGEIMVQAEKLLREGRYFQAEREYARALRFQSHHPLALAGLASAQLGAGLHVAAGVSVRNLFTRHPEMIDVSYAAELLPPRERMDDYVEVLTYQVENDQASSESALVLAYIGHLTEQPDLITQAAAYMEERDDRDALPIVLRGVWLEEDVEQRLHHLRNPDEIDLSDPADD